MAFLNSFTACVGIRIWEAFWENLAECARESNGCMYLGHIWPAWLSWALGPKFEAYSAILGTGITHRSYTSTWTTLLSLLKRWSYTPSRTALPVFLQSLLFETIFSQFWGVSLILVLLVWGHSHLRFFFFFFCDRRRHCPCSPWLAPTVSCTDTARVFSW